MPADEDTDPATPSALAPPSLMTISRQVAALSKQLHLQRDLIERTNQIAHERTREEVGGLVRASLAPQPRTSIAARAASKTASYTKAALAVLGALAAVAQLLSTDSRLKGPILAIADVLSVALGGQP